MSLEDIRKTKNEDINLLLDMLSLYNKFSEKQSKKKTAKKPNRIYYD